MRRDYQLVVLIFMCFSLHVAAALCPDANHPDLVKSWARSAREKDKQLCRSDIKWMGTLLYSNANLYESKVEGASGEIIRQKEIHSQLAKTRSPLQICESGFNAGHSAVSWLLAAPHAKYQGFDAGELFHKYPRKNMELLQLLFGKERVQVEFGDSRNTLLEFAKRRTTNRTVVGTFVCDLIHVDGGHFEDVPYKDLANFRHIADRSTLLVMDDINCDPRSCLFPKSGCRVPMMEWAAATQGPNPWIREVECHNFRGESAGKDGGECRGHCNGKSVNCRTTL